LRTEKLKSWLLSLKIFVYSFSRNNLRKIQTAQKQGSYFLLKNVIADKILANFLLLTVILIYDKINL